MGIGGADISCSLELSRGIGDEPALQGLLRVYKDYYPEIILGGTKISRNSFPPVSETCFLYFHIVKMLGGDMAV